jgi:hypothetical protein
MKAKKARRTRVNPYLSQLGKIQKAFTLMAQCQEHTGFALHRIAEAHEAIAEHVANPIPPIPRPTLTEAGSRMRANYASAVESLFDAARGLSRCQFDYSEVRDYVEQARRALLLILDNNAAPKKPTDA